MNCRLQHIDYMLLKLCSLEVCYKCTVGQLLWHDAAVLCCTISIIFGCEQDWTSSGRITLVWVMLALCQHKGFCEVSLQPHVLPLAAVRRRKITGSETPVLQPSGFGSLGPLNSNIYKTSHSQKSIRISFKWFFLFLTIVCWMYCSLPLVMEGGKKSVVTFPSTPYTSFEI